MKKIQSLTINKIMMFTDIHWGARSNSVIHNQDNLEYLDWFISMIDSNVTHIGFLGDWFEHRSAINVQSLSMSCKGLRKLDDLGLPIFFITGNHDLYRRHTRDVHSLDVFSEFKNVILIDDVTEVNDKFLFMPFLFHEEYSKYLPIINDHEVVFGHFEFKNFVITGYNTVMEHGPDHKLFNGPKKIFSGHYHKRQVSDNVVYIGNVFPTNFGDAGDFERGACTYYVQDDRVEFHDWEDAPTYSKTYLSKVMEGQWNPKPKMKVKCVIDVEIPYSEAQELREGMIELYGLRDFVLEEDRASKQGLLEGDSVKVTDSIGVDFTSIDDMVITQLEAAKDDKKLNLDVNLLVQIYKDIKIEVAEGEED